MSDYSISGVGLQTGTFPDVGFVSRTYPQPAAGHDFTITVPGSGEWWEIEAIRVLFTTSSAVANRALTFNVKDANGVIVWQSAWGTVVTASIAEGVVLSHNYNSVTGDISATKIVTLPFPKGPFLPNWTINSVTGAIDTGDQFSAVSCWFTQYGPDYGSGGTD